MTIFGLSLCSSGIFLSYSACHRFSRAKLLAACTGKATLCRPRIAAPASTWARRIPESARSSGSCDNRQESLKPHYPCAPIYPFNTVGTHSAAVFNNKIAASDFSVRIQSIFLPERALFYFYLTYIINPQSHYLVNVCFLQDCSTASVILKGFP